MFGLKIEAVLANGNTVQKVNIRKVADRHITEPCKGGGDLNDKTTCIQEGKKKTMRFKHKGDESRAVMGKRGQKSQNMVSHSSQKVYKTGKEGIF